MAAALPEPIILSMRTARTFDLAAAWRSVVAEAVEESVIDRAVERAECSEQPRVWRRPGLRLRPVRPHAASAPLPARHPMWLGSWNRNRRAGSASARSLNVSNIADHAPRALHRAAASTLPLRASPMRSSTSSSRSTGICSCSRGWSST
jgi:hypothetical protein